MNQLFNSYRCQTREKLLAAVRNRLENTQSVLSDPNHLKDVQAKRCKYIVIVKQLSTLTASE
jgi:hypothetical protein